MATLITLLDSTGLRVGKAIHLSIGHVMLTAAPPHLVVRDTKFGKSRLVPLHPQYSDDTRAVYDRTETAYL